MWVKFIFVNSLCFLHLFIMCGLVINIPELRWLRFCKKESWIILFVAIIITFTISCHVMKDIITKQRWLQIFLAPSVKMVSGHLYVFFCRLNTYQKDGEGAPLFGESQKCLILGQILCLPSSCLSCNERGLLNMTDIWNLSPHDRR